MNSGHIANISHTTFSIALPLYLFIKENHKHTCMRAMCTAHTYDLLNTIASIDQVHDSLHRSRARTQTLHRHTRTTHVHAFGRAVSESAFTLLFLIVFFSSFFFSSYLRCKMIRARFKLCMLCMSLAHFQSPSYCSATQKFYAIPTTNVTPPLLEYGFDFYIRLVHVWCFFFVSFKIHFCFSAV